MEETASQTSEHWVLAIDIETTGHYNIWKDPVIIGIGACLMGPAPALDAPKKFFFPCRTPDITEKCFETRCWTEFWSKFPDQLAILDTMGTFQEREKEMAHAFHQFRRECEQFVTNYATEHKQEKVKMHIVSDNGPFDCMHVSNLMMKYDICQPLTYTTEGKYCTIWNTHSMQYGFLAGAHPEKKDKWRLTQAIEDRYDLPKPEVVHDHNPANDAYSIAREFQTLLGIRDGLFHAKNVEGS